MILLREHPIFSAGESFHWQVADGDSDVDKTSTSPSHMILGGTVACAFHVGAQFTAIIHKYACLRHGGLGQWRSPVDLSAYACRVVKVGPKSVACT